MYIVFFMLIMYDRDHHKLFFFLSVYVSVK